MSAVRGKKRLSEVEYDKTSREARRLYLQEELTIRPVAARLTAPDPPAHGWLVAPGVRLERGRRSPYTNPTQPGSPQRPTTWPALCPGPSAAADTRVPRSAHTA